KKMQTPLSMTARNILTSAPPHAVEEALNQLGANLRIARLRRNLTIEDVARKIGAGPRSVSNAEQGKPSTGIAVYIALLWAYDLLEPFGKIADPTLDVEGQSLTLGRQRARTRYAKSMDNNF
ncbi:MAG: helix-turn-helix transcriptional regulator, partial [Gammaproteobacteria bacterium]|nr:helix-turn-helix transcriptional regulator [Gammaproteobacteria bacterium]